MVKSTTKPLKFTLGQWLECLWLNFVDALVPVFFASPVISWLLHLSK